MSASISSKEVRRIPHSSRRHVYQTLVDILSVSENDRFHVITEHPKSGLPFDRDYLGLHRTDDRIFFQITLSARGLLGIKANDHNPFGMPVSFEDL